jgi:hypothetical protein
MTISETPVAEGNAGAIEPNTSSFRLVGIATDLLAAIRRGGPDAWGRPAVRSTAGGGEPMRCCRGNARAGESLLLFAFRPPLPGPGSPYEEVGPVFVHAEPYYPSTDDGKYPAAWFGRPQVLRAYDERGWIHPASRVHDGNHADRQLAEVLATPGVVEVHSRNIVYGCWMFTAVAG